MINVAIDISPLSTASKFRGVGMYTRKLIEFLQYKEGLVVLTFERGRIPDKADLVHYPYFFPFDLTLPFFSTKKFLVTIHDLIPLIFPEAYPPGVKGKLKFVIQKKLIKKASAILTDSLNSKNDIVKLLDVPSDKINTVYLAAASNMSKVTEAELLGKITRKFGLPDEFVLYVGDVNYNKNLPSLVKACRKVGIPLVIVGKQAIQRNFNQNHIENRPLLELNSLIGNEKDVIRLGFVGEDDLSALYSLASVYCQPSLYEGFGFPILEAMACGCPVVASHTSSLPEIGGKAAFYVDPYSIDDIGRGIKTVLEGSVLRSKMIKDGLEQAGKFSWEKTAQETIRVYEKVLGR